MIWAVPIITGSALNFPCIYAPKVLHTRKFRHNNTGTVSSDRNGNPHFSPSESILEVNPNGWNLPTPNLRVFTFSELKNATKNFKSEYVLGEGGFGTVFKGWIGDNNLCGSGRGYVVAVKKLNSESMQGIKEWQSEVNFLGRLSHLNIVRLLGYCLEEKELLLIYEFMGKGSLENHLFRRHVHGVGLAWKLRLKIMLGVARALAFLHSSENNIIYRDVKTSNILLDVNYNAKLSDFGLAKHGPINDESYVTTPTTGTSGYAAHEYIDNGHSHVTTRVMGTYGYAAPEYVATGHLYVKSDVYGFGVVLLEVLTGQRALDANRPSGKHNLVEWLKPSLSNRRKLSRIMDPKLKNQYSAKAAKQVAELIEKCVRPEPRGRPSMEEVVRSLEHIEAMESKSKNQGRP
ncbi:non-specific serine/threonine protein kinase [Ranunculus cassubicifolius]